MTADDTQLVIERSFYEALRLILVDRNLTPDISTLTGSQDNYQLYLDMLAQIKQTKGYSINLFGTGNPQNRGVANTSTIAIDSIAFTPGDYGMDPSEVMPEIDPPYNMVRHDNLSYNFYLDVIISTDLKEAEREMVKALHTALPLRGQLKRYDNEEKFIIRVISSVDESMLRDGLMRKRYAFEIPDVVFYAPLETYEVVPMIEYNLEIKHYLGIN